MAIFNRKVLLQQRHETSIYPHLTLLSKMNSHGSGGYPLTCGGRTLLVVWSLLLLGGFILASSLHPDPRGYGTHQRLGLPPCTFRALFGMPCPGCGMTTSFAHFVRGDVPSAIRANAAGCLLATVCCLAIPWCWWSAFRGELWRVAEPGPLGLRLFLSLAAVSGLNWLMHVWL